MSRWKTVKVLRIRKKRWGMKKKKITNGRMGERKEKGWKREIESI